MSADYPRLIYYPIPCIGMSEMTSVLQVNVTTATPSPLFTKAKAQAMKAAQKEVDKAAAEGYNVRYADEDFSIIVALQNWPVTSKMIRGLDVKYKAIFAKAQLAELYPENTFSARIERYSGGRALNIRFKGPRILKQSECRRLERIYADAGHTDSQTDYFDYDNYCDISEDSDQHSTRYATFPQCSFCSGKYERMAVTTDNRNMCDVCRSNCFRHGISSFKSLPEGDE